MLEEVIDIFAGVPEGVVLDATVGGGGHALALLNAFPQLSVVGLDQDEEAVAAATSALAPFGARAAVVRARFDSLGTVLDERGVRLLSGAIFDLGVSSPQLDRPERGFSYRFDGPLDMRMDRSQGLTAARVVNESTEEQLARLFALHGETSFARRIAAAIVSARPLTTTQQLADVVSSAVPAAARRRGHPAKRVFQALRVAVNSELEVLPLAIDAALERLGPGGAHRGPVVPLGRGPGGKATARVRGDWRVQLPPRPAVRMRCRPHGAPAQPGCPQAVGRRSGRQPAC